MKTWISTTVLALAASCVSLASPVDCPAAATQPNTIGTLNLGSTFTTCGNVSVSSGVGAIDATSGFEPTSVLNPYLGLGGGTLRSAGGIVAADGSALQFTFVAAAGSTVSFDFNSTFEQGATAFTLRCSTAR